MVCGVLANKGNKRGIGLLLFTIPQVTIRKRNKTPVVYDFEKFPYSAYIYVFEKHENRTITFIFRIPLTRKQERKQTIAFLSIVIDMIIGCGTPRQFEIVKH